MAAVTQGQLALPAAGGTRPERAAQPLAALLSCAGLTMLFGGLIAAYLTLRSKVDPWPPEDVEFDNYLGTMLTLTLLLSMPALEWAVYAVRQGFRGQALTALATAIGLGVAFLVGLWYLVDVRIEYSAADHAYGVMALAMLLVVAVTTLVAVAFCLLTLFRTAGGQLSPSNPSQVRATAWYWHFAAAGWIAVWLAVFVTK